jgi:hypothetical protein
MSPGSMSSEMDKSTGGKTTAIVYPTEMAGAIADSVKTALMYYSGTEIGKILQIISRGHSRVNPMNGLPRWMVNNWPKDLPPLREFTNKQDPIVLKLNDPVFCFLVVISRMKHFVLPSKTDRCFGISATANSGHDPAPCIALEFLRGYKQNDSNWTMMGVGVAGIGSQGVITGLRNNQACKNKSIIYIEDAAYARAVPGDNHTRSWYSLGLDIYKQFQAAVPTAEVGATPLYYKHMFMYGCMHAQEVTDMNGKKIMAWGDHHERWLQILPVIEMAFVMESLDQGGSTYIKIRNFRQASTHWIAAMFADCFEVVEAIPLPEQCAQSVILCCHGFKRIELGGNIETFVEYLKQCSDSLDSEVFLHPQSLQYVTNKPIFKQRLKEFETIGNYMEHYDNVTYMLMDCAFAAYKSNPHDLDIFKVARESNRVTGALAKQLCSDFRKHMDIVAHGHNPHFKFQNELTALLLDGEC